MRSQWEGGPTSERNNEWVGVAVLYGSLAPVSMEDPKKSLTYLRRYA